MADEKTNEESKTPPTPKDAEPSEKSEAAPPQEDVLGVPATSRLPIEALLQLPPPTPPRVGPEMGDAAQLLELAATGEALPDDPMAQAQAEAFPMPQDEINLGPTRGERLRSALQQGSQTAHVLKQYTPRNLAKSTVEHGLDAAFSRRPPEQS